MIHPPLVIFSFTVVMILSLFSLLTPENREVGQKLGVATLFMFTLPILAFWIVRETIVSLEWSNQPDNWAGGAAILVTNIIVGIYCYAAYIEDLHDDDVQGKLRSSSNDNDASQPRVGIYKQRTD